MSVSNPGFGFIDKSEYEYTLFPSCCLEVIFSYAVQYHIMHLELPLSDPLDIKMKEIKFAPHP